MLVYYYCIFFSFLVVLLTLDSIPVWIRWLRYASLFRYSIEALAVNEVDGLYFNQTMYVSSLSLYLLYIMSIHFLYCIFSLSISLSLFLSSNSSSVLVPGTEILTSQGYKTKWLWYNQIRLGGLALIVPHPHLHYSEAHKEKEIKEQ